MSETSTDKRSFSGDVLWFFSTNVMSVVLRFVTLVVIARTLGPAGRGAVSMFVLIAAVLNNLLCLGVHQANVYYAESKRFRPGALLANSTLLVLTVAVFVTPALWLARGQVTVWFDLQTYQTAYLWCCILLPLILAEGLYVNILVGEKRFAERNIGQIFFSCGQFVAAIILVWWLGMGVSGGVAATTIGYFLITLFIFQRLGGFSLKSFPKPDWGLLGHSIVYGVKGQLGSLMQLLNYRVDMFIVNYFVGVEGVGIYGVAVAIAELVWMLPQVVGNVLFAMSSADQERYDDHYVASAVRKSLVLMFACSGGLIAASYVLVPLVFGREFAASVLPLVILVPGVIAMGFWKILTYSLMGKGHPQYLSYAAAITLGLMIPLDFVLIPLWGVPGASLASTLAYMGCAGCTLFWYTRRSKLSWREIAIPCWEDVLYFIKWAKSRVAKRMTDDSEEDGADHGAVDFIDGTNS